MLYSIRDTMKTLSVGRTSVYNLIKAGRLETVKLGSRTLVKMSSIHALVEAGEVAQELIGRKLSGKFLQAALGERDRAQARRRAVTAQ